MRDHQDAAVPPQFRDGLVDEPLGLAIQCLLFRLFVLVLERRLPDTEDFVASTALSNEIMNAIYYIGKHYAQNPTLDEVAHSVGYSAGYFSRLFHHQLGKNYSEYLALIKIHAVQEQLTHTSKSITQIALECGYRHPSNLTAQFERIVGMRPMEYRRQNS